MQTNIFESTADGYAGRVRLFGINEAIVLVALDPSDAENAPDYRVHLDDEDGPRGRRRVETGRRTCRRLYRVGDRQPAVPGGVPAGAVPCR